MKETEEQAEERRFSARIAEREWEPYVVEYGAGDDKRKRLHSCAWPGGYPLVYYTKRGDGLCAKCATLSLREEDPGDPPTMVDVYWEGPSTFCADCNVEIESAYGDPENGDGKRDVCADCGEKILSAKQLVAHGVRGLTSGCGTDDGRPRCGRCWKCCDRVTKEA